MMRKQIESAIAGVVHINRRTIHATEGSTCKKDTTFVGLLERCLSSFNILGVDYSFVDLNHVTSVCTPWVQFQVFIIQKFILSIDFCTSNCEVLGVLILCVICEWLSVFLHLDSLSAGVCSRINLSFDSIFSRLSIRCFSFWLRFH